MLSTATLGRRACCGKVRWRRRVDGKSRARKDARMQERKDGLLLPGRRGGKHIGLSSRHTNVSAEALIAARRKRRDCKATRIAKTIPGGSPPVASCDVAHSPKRVLRTLQSYRPVVRQHLPEAERTDARATVLAKGTNQRTATVSSATIRLARARQPNYPRTQKERESEVKVTVTTDATRCLSRLGESKICAKGCSYKRANYMYLGDRLHASRRSGFSHLGLSARSLMLLNEI